MKIGKFVGRTEAILESCSGKRVLHLGCVGFTDTPSAKKVELAQESLHARISRSSECVGIDLDSLAVSELKKEEVFDNVLVGDVEHLGEFKGQLEPFDVVLAGDIIEHVSNPGLMLDGIHGFLKNDGTLLVSTPNSFGIAAILRFIKGTFREGAQHVMCFNPITLRQLLERHGYEVIRADTCYQDQAAKNLGGAFGVLKSALGRFPKFGGTLIYFCRRADEPSDS